MSTLAPIPSRMERGTLGLFAIAGAVLGLTLTIAPIRRITHMLSTGETPVTLLTQTAVPHEPSGTVSILSADYTTASVVATGLSDGTRALVAIGSGFEALTAAVSIGAVVYFLLLLMWRRPFHRSLVAATLLAGFALTSGSILAIGLGGLGRMQAASELNPAAHDVFEIASMFDLTPVLVGIGALTLSFVFQRGGQLQRDTEGLV